jgi:hypothetical protein
MEIQNAYSSILTFHEEMLESLDKEIAKKITIEHIKSLRIHKDVIDAQKLANKEFDKEKDKIKGKTEGTNNTSSSSSGKLELSEDEKKKKEEEKAEDDKKTTKEPIWYKQLKHGEKTNANVVSHILDRIPDNYKYQLDTVKEQFDIIKSSLNKLSDDDNNLMKKLSEHFLQMTVELMEIKNIEDGIIDVSVKEQPKAYLGLQNYILETPSLETKSTASTSKVKSLVDEIMKGKFYLDKGDVGNKEEMHKLFDKLEARAIPKNKLIRINYDEIKILRENKENLKLFIDRVMQYADTNGFLAVKNSSTKPNDGQLKLCMILEAIRDSVLDKPDEKEELQKKKTLIHPTCEYKEDKKDKGKSGQSQNRDRKS